MRLFTDYPIIELGDTPHRIAPIRACRLLAFNGNKHATILVSGIVVMIKFGYLYRDRMRADQRRAYTRAGWPRWNILMRFRRKVSA